MNKETSAASDITVSDALRSCQEACSQILDALLKRPQVVVTNFGSDDTPSDPALSTLRTDFISLLSLVYSHATRVGMSFKPPITELAAIKSLQGLSADTDRLATCALAVPSSAGRTLGKQFIWAAQEVVESVQSLASGLLAATITSSSDEYLRRVGQVHVVVEKIKSSLPVDQLSAIEQIWKANSEAVEDAVNECKELMEGGGDDHAMFDDEEWDGLDMGDEASKQALTAEELKRTEQVYTTLRLTLALHQKLIKQYSKSPPADGAVLETRLDRSTNLVAAVDELVSSLPSPQDETAVKSKFKDVLEFSKSAKADMDMASMTNRGIGSMSIREVGGGVADETKRAQWFRTCLEQIEKASKPLLP
ncbi:hypothetical protein FRB97_001310 [Tulasnella sp. 331]|nr:hypothetical protein FRB97_001310 [Tulasnella sp. 331]